MSLDSTEINGHVKVDETLDVGNSVGGGGDGGGGDGGGGGDVDDVDPLKNNGKKDSSSTPIIIDEDENSYEIASEAKVANDDHDSSSATEKSTSVPSIDTPMDISTPSSNDGDMPHLQLSPPTVEASVDAPVPVTFENDSSKHFEDSAIDSTDVDADALADEDKGVLERTFHDDDDDDANDDDADDVEDFETRLHRLRSLDDVDLPQTVQRLTTKYGTRIFLIGTAHFSEESQADVSATIRAVEPDVIMVELCDSRKHVLSLDEETILRESQNINATKVLEFVKKTGLVQGLSYVLLLSLSAQITKQLGMAPGGEFRRAFQETQRLQEKRRNTRIHLGDRPVHVTLKRALGMLSIWQKLHLCWTLLTDKFEISKDDIEKMKQKDMLDTLLQEMAKDYPALSQVFVHERDVWLAHSLRASELMAMSGATGLAGDGSRPLPGIVVGVVGMGHQPGIIAEWRKMEDSQLSKEERSRLLSDLLSIPPSSMATRLLGFSFRAAKISLLLWTCHKIYKWVYPA